jgi:hypothetical protein
VSRDRFDTIALENPTGPGVVPGGDLIFGMGYQNVPTHGVPHPEVPKRASGIWGVGVEKARAAGVVG